MELKAIIFDLDGVVTETSELHYQAWKEMAAEIGISVDRAFNECLKGVSRMDSLELILRHGGKNSYSPVEKTALAARKNERYVELLQGLTPEDVLPGVSALLSACHENGIRTALASASKNAPFILHKLEIERDFDYIADAARVAHSKPAPDIFLAAAEGLGIAPQYCIGIEDAAAGIASIHAAGMKAVGIGTAETLSQADLLLPDTRSLTYEGITAFFRKCDV